MKTINFLIVLFSIFQANAQTTDFPFGTYCFDEDVCLSVVKDSDVDGKSEGNIYIGEGEIRKYIWDSKAKAFFRSENGVKTFSASFTKNDEGCVLTIRDLNDDSYFSFTYVGDKATGSNEEIGSGYYGDTEGGSYEYGIDEEPMTGYYDEENVDQAIVNNPHHISNEEFFNPKKNQKLPMQLDAYDYSHKSRIYDLFETAESIPEDKVDRIVAVFAFLSFQYTEELCYAIYNEADGTHDCYTGSNKLYAKIKFTDNFHYAHFLDLKTKQEIGAMNIITGDSEEFTPPGYLLPGRYTLLDGSDKSFVLEAAQDESENMKMQFSGTEYAVLGGMESPEYQCYSMDGKTAVYSFTCDKEKSGVINLKEIKTGKVFSAKFNFE